MSLQKNWLILCTAVLCFGCAKSVSVDVGTSQGHGIVRRIDFEHHMITLDHDLIPNLLQAMTFAYKVRNDSIMRGLVPNDEVKFTLTESSPGEFLVQSVQKISSAPAPLAPPPDTRSAKKP